MTRKQFITRLTLDVNSYRLANSLPKAAGVYTIVNKVNSRFYIGSTIDLRIRWKAHHRALIRKNHHNPNLQACWNKHNPADFEFAILEIVNDNTLLNEREAAWMKKCDVLNNPYAYNDYMPVSNGGSIRVELEALRVTLDEPVAHDGKAVTAVLNGLARIEGMSRSTMLEKIVLEYAQRVMEGKNNGS